MDSVFYELFNEIYGASPKTPDGIMIGTVQNLDPLQFAVGDLVLPHHRKNASLPELSVGDTVLILADKDLNNFYIICKLEVA